MTGKQTAHDAFMELGFNTLEAEVYVSLLQQGPQTAYRIGKMLNRPTANVYKAVDVLAERGAIEIDESDVRICKAIPIASVGQQLEREYRLKLEKASGLLKQLEVENSDEGIYTLGSVEAVIQRAKEMLARCKTAVAADIFPQPLGILSADLRKLSGKGKEVFLQAYTTDVAIEGITVAVPEVSAQVLSQWKAQQLNLAVDGKEVLVALFNEDMSELIQANYSNNLYLSCMMYAGLRSEYGLHLLSNAKNMEELHSIKGNLQFFVNSEVPGLELLFKQYKKEV